jgi:hypothetical protein
MIEKIRKPESFAYFNLYDVQKKREGNTILKLMVALAHLKQKGKAYPCNRPWKPIRL